MKNRCMVLIGTEARTPDGVVIGPRNEFMEIARATKAIVASYTSGVTRWGKIFKYVFRNKLNLGAAVHAFAVSGNVDAIYVTGEDIGLPLAALLKLKRWPGRLVCVFHNVTPKKRLFLRVLGSRIFHRIIVVSDTQRQSLIDTCKIPAESVITVHNWVDTEFFKPEDAASQANYFMSCGAENRDYETLVAAAPSITAPIRIYGHGHFGAGGKNTDANTPNNIEFCPRVSFEELRRSYSRSLAVIIPLNDVGYAAGVTGLVEAMAMGRPVVVSRSSGITDYLESINPGVIVEPGDADDLSRAALAMRDDPENWAAAGSRNRQWALDHCSLDRYVSDVSKVMLV